MKKKEKWIGIIALLILFVGTLQVGKICLQYRESKKEYEELNDYAMEETAAEEIETEEDFTEEVKEEESERIQKSHLEYPKKYIDFDSLSAMNPECVAWLYVEALGINYPVVQGENDQKYLHLSFMKKENLAGAIFLDAYNEPDFTSYSTFIFGHNMKNGTMFGKLKQFYQDESGTLARENPYIYIYTKDEVVKYEIFAYYLTTNESDIYRDIQTREEYEELLQEIQEYSLYKREPQKKAEKDSNIGLLEGEHLLTLSTCSGTSGNKRFVVHAMEVGREEK